MGAWNRQAQQSAQALPGAGRLHIPRSPRLPTGVPRVKTIDRQGAPESQDGPSRVLQVVGNMALGGAETMLMNLYRVLDRQRVQFDFLVFSETRGAYEAEVESLGGRILRMPAPAHLGPWVALRTMTSLIRSEGPFVAVHSHINFASALPLAAAKRAGVPRRVAHAHIAGSSQAGAARALYTRTARVVILSTSTDIVGCGDAAGAYLFGRGWRGRGQMLPNAIDVDRYSQADGEKGTQALRDSGVDAGTRVVGSVARLTHQKNHSFLLEVLGRLEGTQPPVVLVVIGEGELRADLEIEAHRLGVMDKVLFLGTRRDVPELLKSFDLLVLPSHYEGMPLVLVEAQAAGLPCLVADTVSREIDLGLGLLEYLPLDLDRWVSRIRQRDRVSLGVDQVREALSREGYAAADSLARLLAVYGLQ